MKPRIRLDFWIVCFGVIVPVIYGIVFISNPYIAAEFSKPGWSASGNIATHLSALQALLFTLLGIIISIHEAVIKTKPKWLIKFLNRNEPWMQQTSDSNIRNLLIEIHRSLYKHNLSGRGYDYILSPDQIDIGVRIRYKWFKKEFKKILNTYVSDSSVLDTLNNLTQQRKYYISGKEVMLIQLALIIRCGFIPQSKQFNSLWKFILNYVFSYNMLLPRELNNDELQTLKYIWSLITPMDKVNILRYANITKLEELLSLVKHIIEVKNEHNN